MLWANHRVWVDKKFQVYFQLKNESGQLGRVVSIRHNLLAKWVSRVVSSYPVHKCVVFGFRVSTRLANCVGFGLALTNCGINPNPVRQPVLQTLHAVYKIIEKYSRYAKITI